MTLQASGAIKLSEIQTEFGGTNPIAISEYYGSDTVPASGVISMSDFYGTSAVQDVAAGFDRASYSASQTDAGSAIAVIGFYNTGLILATNDTAGYWDGGNTISGADVDIRFTNLVGDTPAGLTENTWYDITTFRGLSLNDAVSRSCTFTLELRDANTLNVIDTASGSISITVT